MRIKRVSENKYAAYDEDFNRVGTCTVRRRELSRIFPDRPVQYEIIVNCNEESRYLLWGAAVTRARMLAESQRMPSRVYTCLSPENSEERQILTDLGFTETDMIIRTVKPVTDEQVNLPIPYGCTIVRDYLTNENEIRKCLTRYNECFGTNESRSWLIGLSEKPDFARILMVSPDELCGELMVWRSGKNGVIGIIQTARKWREKGVAGYLIEDARKYFATMDLENILFDVWLASPGCKELARSSGFKKGSIIELRPEILIG